MLGFGKSKPLVGLDIGSSSIKAVELQRAGKALELSRLGIPYADEYPVGRRDCDIYLPDLKRLVEIDGPTHLRRADERRDAEIMAERPDLNIVHVKVGTPVSEAMELILAES